MMSTRAPVVIEAGPPRGTSVNNDPDSRGPKFSPEPSPAEELAALRATMERLAPVEGMLELESAETFLARMKAREARAQE